MGGANKRWAVEGALLIEFKVKRADLIDSESSGSAYLPLYVVQGEAGGVSESWIVKGPCMSLSL